MIRSFMGGYDEERGFILWRHLSPLRAVGSTRLLCHGVWWVGWMGVVFFSGPSLTLGLWFSSTVVAFVLSLFLKIAKHACMSDVAIIKAWLVAW